MQLPGAGDSVLFFARGPALRAPQRRALQRAAQPQAPQPQHELEPRAQAHPGQQRGAAVSGRPGYLNLSRNGAVKRCRRDLFDTAQSGRPRRCRLPVSRFPTMASHVAGSPRRESLSGNRLAADALAHEDREDSCRRFPAGHCGHSNPWVTARSCSSPASCRWTPRPAAW